MNSSANIVITGLGMVTPLGRQPETILGRIEAGTRAAVPTGFEALGFACPGCARIPDFEPHRYLAEAKMIRLMNRDAQLAVAAAHLALEDAGLAEDRPYAPEAIGLFGATGLCGLPLSEVAPLIRASAGPDGRFSPACFGQAGLKSISPILSFKILGNMPVCFVSICENIQGPNAIYTPWEGQGAQAIEAGLRALQSGEVACALVGGCDVKTHELAFINLEQLGLFRSWQERGDGVLPGEGAVFLVLEEEQQARSRGARIYARLAGFSFRTHGQGQPCRETYREVFQALQGARGGTARALSPGWAAPFAPAAVVAAGEGGESAPHPEALALADWIDAATPRLYPKKFAGNLFAAAAALQVGLGALLVQRHGREVLANCFGYGSEQAAFVLETAPAGVSAGTS